MSYLMGRPACFVVTIAALLVGTTDRGRAEYDDGCKDLSDVGHSQCADADATRVDGLLNEVYARKRKAFAADRTGLHAFVESEKRWIRRRDSDCKGRVKSDDVIGRTADIEYANCLAEEAHKRIEYLQGLRPGPDR